MGNQGLSNRLHMAEVKMLVHNLNTAELYHRRIPKPCVAFVLTDGEWQWAATQGGWPVSPSTCGVIMSTPLLYQNK